MRPAHTAPPRSVLVVGAGVVGSSTAYFLTNRPDAPRVTLIDAAPEPATAASGKAGGFLARDWGAHGPLGEAGFDLIADLAAEFGEEEIGWRRLETVSASFPPVGAKRPPPTTTHWFDAPTGRVRRLGTPATTAQVHPRLLTRALVAAAVDRGAETRFNTSIASIAVDGGRVAGVVTDNGDTLPADAVVVAAGPWTGRVTVGGTPVAAVDGQRAHSIVVTPTEPVAATALFSSCGRAGRPAAEPEFYPRPPSADSPAGSVYVCGESDDAPLPARSVDVAADAAACAHLRAAAAAVAPRTLGDGATLTVAAQACYLPVTRAGGPVIGETSTRGLYVAAGHSCWGILCGPITGKAVAELVVEGEAKCVDLRGFRPR